MKALRDLFFCELANRLSSEKQLVRGMPFVIEGATASTLQSLMLTHFHETERQVEKLTLVFQAFQQPAKTTKCEVTAKLMHEVDPGNRTSAEVVVLELGGAGVNQNLKLENESQT